MINDALKELVPRWTAALRSGDYKQGSKYLCKHNSYCCLGVLCEVEKIPKYAVGDVLSDAEPVKFFSYENEVGFLPASLVDKFGISLSGRFHPSKVIELKFARFRNFDTLTEINDSGKFTFNEIADFIEYLVEVDGFVNLD